MCNKSGTSGKKAFSVTLQYSESVYCTNIAYAASEEDVRRHYSKYTAVTVREAADWEVEAGKKKGMPVIVCE